MIRSPNFQIQTVEQFQVEAAFCLNHGFDLEIAADYGWIVRESATGHNGQIHGCIDQLGDGVELMRLDGGFRWSSYACLHDALEDLVRHLTQDRRAEAVET